MQWIADRFFNVSGTWVDAASGSPVRLCVSDSADDLAWSDVCGTLMTLRHPLLNTLIDFGAASATRRFEAYSVAPTRSGRPPASVVEPLNEFLNVHDVTLDAERFEHAVVVLRGRGEPRDQIGVRLQPRAALRAFDEALEPTSPPGPSLLNVCGVPGMGLRTFCTLAARAARLRGFVPIAGEAIRRYPELLTAARERHVCLMEPSADRATHAASAALIAALSASSTRRHVVVHLHRHPERMGRGLMLEPLSVAALVRMVFVPPGLDRRPEALVSAARRADGNPGRLLDALRGGDRKRIGRAFVVHETPSPYVVEGASDALEPPIVGGRLLGSALRAVPRAAGLARQGRHAAAARVLSRALRVLAGRQRPEDAATCAVRLGELALDRADTAGATTHFETASRLTAGSGRLRGAAGHSTALTDSARFGDAEAVARGALAAAAGSRDVAAAAEAAAALARALYWQRKEHEALALIESQRREALPAHARARLLTMQARCEARAGRSAAAVESARQAQRAAVACEDVRLSASADLALAEVLRAAGDRPGARAAVVRVQRVARAAHLPLFRVRAMLALAADGDDLARRALSRIDRARLTPLLAQRIEEALLAGPLVASRVEPVVELEQLLDLAQRAADDQAALGSICKAVAERVGAGGVAVVARDERTLASEGRHWRPVSDRIREVIMCGTRVLPDGCREPQEAAEPVRYGGEVIAAFTCRWTPGSLVDRDHAAVVLRAGALSAAASVRALLDTVVTPPQTVWGDLLGESAPAAALRESVMRAARAPFGVLIEGESGAGKELVARAIHRLSQRRERKFCALNCAALADDLLEAELFGHTRGAFTGAASERAGLFEEADGGALFLDEVGELSPRAQAKLLRVLQEGEVRRVGENMPRRVDVRVIAATNRRLEEEVAAGRFRTDLRFRLDVVRIHVPPLRERVADIPLLASHFWRDASARVGSHASLSSDAMSALARYDWPGNVRELQNVIAWIAVHSPRRGRIGPAALPRHIAQATPVGARTFEAAREEFERRMIRAALAGANGRRARAADALGITRQGLSKMMRRLRIDPAGQR